VYCSLAYSHGIFSINYLKQGMAMNNLAFPSPLNVKACVLANCHQTYKNPKSYKNT
jgi:hypothetical protein